MSPRPTTLLIKSYPGRLVGKIPLPYWMSLLILWEIIFLVDYLYSISIPGGHDHSLAFGGAIFFFALVCINVVYCSKILTELYPDLTLFIDHDQHELRNWYEKKLKVCYEGVWPLVAGLFFVILEELTIGRSVRFFTPENEFLQGLRNGYRIAGFFFLGI